MTKPLGPPPYPLNAANANEIVVTLYDPDSNVRGHVRIQRGPMPHILQVGPEFYLHNARVMGYVLASCRYVEIDDTFFKEPKP